MTDSEIIKEIMEGTAAMIEETIQLITIMVTVKKIITYAIILIIQVITNTNVGHLFMRAIFISRNAETKEKDHGFIDGIPSEHLEYLLASDLTPS